MTKSMEMSGGGTAVRGRYQNGTAPQSRLQLLQADFQKKLMKEKEEKLLHLYEENQQRALGRLNNRQNSSGLNRKGSVREFFSERRNLNAQGKGGVPPIHQHYSQYQSSPTGSAKTYHSTSSYQSGISQTSNKSYNSANSRSSGQNYRNSAGRDRSKPLASLGQKQGPDSSPTGSPSNRKTLVPPIQRKPQLYQRKPAPGGRTSNNSRFQSSNNSQYDQDHSEYDEEDWQPSNPPPQRGGRTSLPIRKESPQKMTDFQKWQQEQNRAREERLQKAKPRHSNSYIHDDSELDEQDSGIDLNDEIRRRQEEIQTQLENQQAELERIQVQRQQAEDKERQRKSRQERAERDRQRRLEEQKERHRAAEEERLRLQEERRQADQLRVEEDEKSHNSRTSRRSRGSNYRQSDEEYVSPRPPPVKTRPAVSKPRRPVPPPARRQSHRPPPQQPEDDEDMIAVPGPGIDIYEQAANDQEAFGEVGNLAPCKVCGRRFARDRLPKHQQACKNVSKPRKVFDPVKMRTEGTELAQYVRSGRHKKQPVMNKKKNNWRAQHESFIESIRYAKKMSEYEANGGKLSDLPPPPPSDTSDYVQCPHCNRRFNQGVAERHIPKCVNIRAKPRPPPNKRR